jgi:hypothetical protein
MEADAQKEYNDECKIGYINDFDVVREAQNITEIIEQIKRHNNKLRATIEERTK